jgi:hypothetical protein
MPVPLHQLEKLSAGIEFQKKDVKMFSLNQVVGLLDEGMGKLTRNIVLILHHLLI